MAGRYRNAVPIEETGEEEWIRIVPVGDFPNHPDGAHEVTPEHIEEMVRNHDRLQVDVLFDKDHRSLFGDTRATAWAEDLEAREDGLYCRTPQLTPYGEGLVNGREYRYYSPVYALDTTDKQGEALGARIHSVAFTNTPYMDAGEIDAIGNAGRGAAAPDDSSSPTDSDEEPFMEREELIDLLDLDDDVTDEELEAAVREAQEARAAAEEEDDDGGDDAEPQPDDEGEDEGDGEAEDEGDDASVEEMVNRKVNAALAEWDNENEAEQLVDEAIADGKIAPSQKATYLNAAKRDLDGTREALGALDEDEALPDGVTVNSGGGNGATKRPGSGSGGPMMDRINEQAQQQA